MVDDQQHTLKSVTQRLVIVGAGGFGREVFAVIVAVNRVDPQFEVLGFLDDGQPDANRLDRIGMRLLGTTDECPDATYVIGIGMLTTVRRQLDDRLQRQGRSPCDPIVHPSASVGPDVLLGEGTVLCAGVGITTNVRLGRHVHVNPGTVIGHDCRIGDYVTLTPGCVVGGAVTVEDGAVLGSGCIVLPGVRVGRDALVGAGAVVTSDVVPGTTVIGVPAKAR